MHEPNNQVVIRKICEIAEFDFYFWQKWRKLRGIY